LGSLHGFVLKTSEYPFKGMYLFPKRDDPATITHAILVKLPKRMLPADGHVHPSRGIKGEVDRFLGAIRCVPDPSQSLAPDADAVPPHLRSYRVNLHAFRSRWCGEGI